MVVTYLLGGSKQMLVAHYFVKLSELLFGLLYFKAKFIENEFENKLYKN
jgi:hypothetical protein